MRRLAPNLLLATAFVACNSGGNDGAGTFAVRFDTQADVMQCPSSECSDYGIGCGGAMMVRWVDLDGNTAVSHTGDPLITCTDLDAAFDLCGLSDALQLQQFVDVKDGAYQLQVAIWESSRGCTEIEFDSQGRPKNSPSPPAFAGAAYIDTERATDAVIALACANPEQLNDLDCWRAGARLESLIIDMESLTPTTAEDQNMLVQANRPIEISGAPDNDYEFAPTFAFTMEPQRERPSSYLGESEMIFEDHMCTTVLELKPGTGATSACIPVDSPTASVQMTGYLLPLSTQKGILASYGMTPSFPSQGLVVGRVVDTFGNPVPGVVVTSSSGSVDYWSVARDGIQAGSTSTNGYFFSQDAVFGATWTAAHPDGRIGTATQRAGLIQNQVSIAVIEIAFPDSRGR